MAKRVAKRKFYEVQHLKSDSASAKEERIRTVEALENRFHLDKTPEAPDCLNYQSEERVHSAIPFKVIKLGYLSDPMLSKNQTLRLQLAGWTRHPGAGHGARSIDYGDNNTASCWIDVFYRRCRGSVIVLPVAYVWCPDHERPKIKALRDPKSKVKTPEDLAACLTRELHVDAKIDDVLNVDLAYMADSMIAYGQPIPGLYKISDPSPELWAITDPKLADPYRAYYQYCRGHF